MSDPALSPPPAPRKPLGLGLRRGALHRCPNCGEGRLYRSYLKVVSECEHCGHALGDYRADDGPAYFSILLIGHLVVAPTLLMPFIWQWPVEVVLPITILPLAALTLLVLPRVKGAFLGLMWAQRAGAGKIAAGA